MTDHEGSKYIELYKKERKIRDDFIKIMLMVVKMNDLQSKLLKWTDNTGSNYLLMTYERVWCKISITSSYVYW
jgi:hypothetical protein